MVMKGDKKTSKLHVELTPANWKRLTEYIEEYNADPERVTLKLKPAHVINKALYTYLQKKFKELNKGGQDE